MAQHVNNTGNISCHEISMATGPMCLKKKDELPVANPCKRLHVLYMPTVCAAAHGRRSDVATSAKVATAIQHHPVIFSHTIQFQYYNP